MPGTILKLIATVLFALAVLTGCKQEAEHEMNSKHESVQAVGEPSFAPHPYESRPHAEWTRDAVIYQVNIRQFSKEGTFAAVQAQLPRLTKLGVDILWLMPIHPIGEKNRKGSLGSPYSVKDYFDVNPDLGTKDDFKALVDAAHSQGFKVILDWVANHTAWDNPLVEAHPEWYAKDWDGSFRPTPWWDWSDIIELDYNQAGLREYMASALRYWVEEFDIDGYRCDVAGYVPRDFWEDARADLESIRPVFMLAEWETRDMHIKAFDMTYGWTWTEPASHVAHGEKGASSLFLYYAHNERSWPADAYRMLGTTNHDMNAWDDPATERFGDGLIPATVLSFVGEGMPLIYSGQEGGLDRSLAFFESDPIEWRDSPMSELYASLSQLMKGNSALHHGLAGGRMVRVWHDKPEAVFSFTRDNGKDKVLAFINFSAEQQTLTLADGPAAGSYVEYFSGEAITLSLGDSLTVPAHGYKVFEAQ